jgi:hypothetical protein
VSASAIAFEFGSFAGAASFSAAVRERLRISTPSMPLATLSAVEP